MSIDFGTDIYEEPIVAKTFLSEDSAEASLRPHTLREYIGQEKAKQNLSIFIEAARRRTEALDHVLLHGPPGLGKTTLAGIIAAEMGVNIRITSGPAIEKPGDLAALLTNLNENDILFLPDIEFIRNCCKQSSSKSEIVETEDEILTPKKTNNFQKKKNERRSSNEQLEGEQNYVIDKSLGLVFY